MIRNICALLLLFVFAFISCSPQERGVDVYIGHTLKSNLLLKISLFDEEGVELTTRYIPFSDNENYKFSEFNYAFEKLTIISELHSIPNGEIIEKKIAFWPGDAGTSCSADSNRICIQIRIKKMEDKVVLSYDGTV